MLKRALITWMCGAALIGCSEKPAGDKEPAALEAPVAAESTGEAPAPSAPEAKRPRNEPAPAVIAPAAPKPIPKAAQLKVGMSRSELMTLADHCLTRINLVPGGPGRTPVETFEAIEGECRDSLGPRRVRVVGGKVHSLYEVDPTVITKPAPPPELAPPATEG
jgi:hypothetical protein